MHVLHVPFFHVRIYFNSRWVWAYAVVVSATIVFSLWFELYGFTIMIQGSTKLHNQMVRSVMRSPLKFFHMNPTGRILNRFAKDQGMVDDLLPNVFVEVMAILLLALGTIIFVILAVPPILPLFFILLYVFIKIRKKYVMSSREVKRYEGMTRSPIYAIFTENLKVTAPESATSLLLEHMDDLDCFSWILYHQYTWIEWLKFVGIGSSINQSIFCSKTV